MLGDLKLFECDLDYLLSILDLHCLSEGLPIMPNSSELRWSCDVAIEKGLEKSWHQPNPKVNLPP